MPDITDYRVENAEKRIDDHSAKLDALQDVVTRLTIIEEQNVKQISDIEQRITSLESVPAKRWESVVGYLITAVCAVGVGYFASAAGLS